MTSVQCTSDFTIPLATATAVAKRVCAVFAATATRRLIAGSVRRGKPRCADIDIVLAPRFDTDLGGRFAGWSQPFLAAVRACPLWTIESKKVTADSRKLTVRSRKEPLLKIELWLATPWNIGWIYLLRTGPSDFTTELVALTGMGLLTSAPAPGGSVYRFQEGRLTCDGASVRTPDEETVFAELGLPFAQVGDRTAAWLQARQREQSAKHRGAA